MENGKEAVIIARIVDEMMSEGVTEAINSGNVIGKIEADLLGISAPAMGFINGIKMILDKDKRLVRACIIVENMGQENHVQDVEEGEIVLSFVFQEKDKLPRFINFALDIEDDLGSMVAMATAMSEVSGQVMSKIDSGGIYGPEHSPDGEDDMAT